MKKTLLTLAAISSAALANVEPVGPTPAKPAEDMNITWIQDGKAVYYTPGTPAATGGREDYETKTIGKVKEGDVILEEMLVSQYCYDKTGDSRFYDALYGALEEKGTLTFNMQFTLGPVQTEEERSAGMSRVMLFHSGSVSSGWGLLLINGQLCFFVARNRETETHQGYALTLGSLQSAYINEPGDGDPQTYKEDEHTHTYTHVMNEATVTISQGTIEAVVNGVKTTQSLAWDDIGWITWNEGKVDENLYGYSVGKRAVPSVWDDNSFREIPGTYLKEFSASYKAAPEPAAATLSLLALAGLCTRRRRK